MRLARGSNELTRARLPTCSLPPALLDCRLSNPVLLLCLLVLLPGETDPGRVGCLSLCVVADEQCWGLPSLLRAASTCNARSRKAGPAVHQVELALRVRATLLH